MRACVLAVRTIQPDLSGPGEWIASGELEDKLLDSERRFEASNDTQDAVMKLLPSLCAGYVRSYVCIIRLRFEKNLGVHTRAPEGAAVTMNNVTEREPAHQGRPGIKDPLG